MRMVVDKSRYSPNCISAPGCGKETEEYLFSSALPDSPHSLKRSLKRNDIREF
jgi:hypothetical protein